MSEQEEFEFRLRYEQEQARAKPAAATKPSGSDDTITRGARMLTPAGLASSLAAEQGRQDLGNAAAGALRGAGSIGASILWPIDAAMDKIKGDRDPGVTSLVTGKKPLSRNQERRQQIDAGLESMGAEPNSLAYQGGKLATEIAGTAGAGGALAGGVRAVSQAPAANALANALASGGFRAGTAPGPVNMLTRIAGGAGAGGGSALLVDPEHAAAGAAIGGALPPVLAGAARAGGYAGRVVNSLAQPFTQRGQEEVVGNILRRFSEGGPTAVDASQIVPGSVPTLAEATGNAGISRLQSAARDLRPNAFVERERANAAARNASFEEVAGSPAELMFHRQFRKQTGNELYEEALNQPAAPLTPYLKGQITQLIKRPSITEARRTAQRWAIERGEKPDPNGSLRALHDMKDAIDDQIAEAVSKGKGGEARALEATMDKLVYVMDELSPGYKEARATYAEMSKPINAMEALQGLRVTDANGNITLAKVKSAIETLERARNTPGVQAAKSVTDEQMRALQALHRDLLRQQHLSAGKSAGSNTFQNIATDNILAQALPGRFAGLAQDKLGGVLGQMGRLAYSGPNEAIRNRLVDMLLDPAQAGQALNPLMAPQLGAAAARAPNPLLNQLAPYAYLSAPVLPAAVQSSGR